MSVGAYVILRDSWASGAVLWRSQCQHKQPLMDNRFRHLQNMEPLTTHPRILEMLQEVNTGRGPRVAASGRIPPEIRVGQAFWWAQDGVGIIEIALAIVRRDLPGLHGPMQVKTEVPTVPTCLCVLAYLLSHYPVVAQCVDIL